MISYMVQYIPPIYLILKEKYKFDFNLTQGFKMIQSYSLLKFEFSPNLISKFQDLHFYIP